MGVAHSDAQWDPIRKHFPKRRNLREWDWPIFRPRRSYLAAWRRLRARGQKATRPKSWAAFPCRTSKTVGSTLRLCDREDSDAPGPSQQPSRGASARAAEFESVRV